MKSIKTAIQVVNDFNRQMKLISDATSFSCDEIVRSFNKSPKKKSGTYHYFENGNRMTGHL